MITGGYQCLQMFEQLSSLIIGIYVVNSLTDCCEIVDNVPHLEDVIVNFAWHNDDTASIDSDSIQELETSDIVSRSTDDESTLASTITQKATTYPKIKKLHLNDYDISTSHNQLDDMLLIKRFNMLSNLDIIFQNVGTPEDLRTVMVDRSVLAFIHSTIPSYKISLETYQDNESEYFDIYFKGLEKVQDGINTSDKFKLKIVENQYSVESVGTGILFKRDIENPADSSDTLNGEIDVSIYSDEQHVDIFTRITSM